jgi:hypothetical protein
MAAEPWCLYRQRMGIRRLSGFVALLAALAFALTFAVQARAANAPKDCGILELPSASWSSGNQPAAVRPHDVCLVKVRAHKHGLARTSGHK